MSMFPLGYMRHKESLFSHKHAYFNSILGRSSLLDRRCKCGLPWSIVILTTSTTGSLSLGTADLASLDAGGWGVLDELLLGDTNKEGWDVDHLFSDSDVSLTDEDTGLVNGSGINSLHNQSLESSLQELGSSKSEDIIELALRVLQESESDHTSDKGLTYFNRNIKLF